MTIAQYEILMEALSLKSVDQDFHLFTALRTLLFILCRSLHCSYRSIPTLYCPQTLLL